MIIVWDNGYDYSDHAVYFIDTLDYDLEDCLKLLGSWRDKGFLVAKAHDIEWFEGGAVRIDDLVSFWSLRDRKIIYEIQPETLKGFYAKWKEHEEDLLGRATGKWADNVRKRYETQFKYLADYCEKL